MGFCPSFTHSVWITQNQCLFPQCQTAFPFVCSSVIYRHLAGNAVIHWIVIQWRIKQVVFEKGRATLVLQYWHHKTASRWKESRVPILRGSTTPQSWKCVGLDSYSKLLLALLMAVSRQQVWQDCLHKHCTQHPRFLVLEGNLIM